jgi:hypothetical protein
MARPPKTTRSKKQPSFLARLITRRYAKPLVVILAFGLVGGGALLVSYAAIPTGPVISQASGKCLENFYNRQQNGNFVSVYPCNNANPAQQWTLASDKSIRTTQNFCLEAPKPVRSGTRAQLWQCNGSAGQKWTLRDNKTLVNPGSGLCLTAAATNTTLGGPNLLMRACDATNKRQQWTLPKSTMPFPLPTPSPTNPPPSTGAWKPLLPGCWMG